MSLPMIVHFGLIWRCHRVRRNRWSMSFRLTKTGSNLPWSARAPARCAKNVRHVPCRAWNVVKWPHALGYHSEPQNDVVHASELWTCGMWHVAALAAVATVDSVAILGWVFRALANSAPIHLSETLDFNWVVFIFFLLLFLFHTVDGEWLSTDAPLMSRYPFDLFSLSANSIEICFMGGCSFPSSLYFDMKSITVDGIYFGTNWIVWNSNTNWFSFAEWDQ